MSRSSTPVDRRFVWMLSILVALFASVGWSARLVPAGRAVAGEAIVKFVASASNADVRDAEQQGDIDQDDHLATVSGGTIRKVHSRSKSTAALIAALSSHQAVAYAEPNYVVQAIATPNDPSYGQLWGLKNTGQTISGSGCCFGNPTGTAGADIKAEAAWNVTTGSRSIIVGVVDTGVDYNHQDLAANIWSNPGGIGGCAAGTHGYNAITKVCDPLDDHYHGTHCSGTIGGVGNNGVGVVGVNWQVSIMGLKFLDSSGSGTTADAITAIDFAVNAKIAGQNVRVLSNSWGGGGFSQALLDEINKANTNNILFVAAAGNNSSNNDVTPNYPSNYATPNMVAVAATDNRDGLASFSNYGATTVHLGAPGVDVFSCQPGNLYQFLSGTSMATPHVAGVAALVLSAPGNSGMTVAQLKSAIINNTDTIPSLPGKTVSGGRLNAAKAVGTPPPTPDYSLSVSPASRSVVQGSSTTYTVTITPTNGFTGSVSFSVSGLPAGAAGSFSPNPATSTSTLTVTTATSTPTGSFALTVTGTSGTLSHTAAATLVVTATPVPDYSLSVSPASQSVVQGASTTYTVTITPTNGFTGSVSLSVSGLPSGAAGSFSPNPATTTSTLSVTTATTTPTGSFALTITGTSGTLSHTASATLVVTAPVTGNFTLAATPTSRTINQGSSTTYTVNITRSGGFTGAVTFSVSGLGTGQTGTFSPNPATGASSTLTVATTASAATGSRTLTITGTSGSLTRTTTVTLVVNAACTDGNCQNWGQEATAPSRAPSCRSPPTPRSLGGVGFLVL